MHAMTHSVLGAAPRAERAAAGRRTAGSRARPLAVPVRAAANEEPERKLSFAPNDRSARGYTTEDSAGQSNIFAVEPKTYVQGSEADTTDTSVSCKYVSTGAAMAFIALLLVAKFSGGPDYSYANPQPLSEYIRMFSQ